MTQRENEELRRDYDRTRTGDEVGQFSGSPERDSDWNAGGTVTRRADQSSPADATGMSDPSAPVTPDQTTANPDDPTATDYLLATGALDTSRLTDPGDAVTGADATGRTNAGTMPDPTERWETDDEIAEAVVIEEVGIISTEDTRITVVAVGAAIPEEDLGPTTDEGDTRSNDTPGSADLQGALSGAAPGGVLANAFGVEPGMQVVTLDGSELGRVKEVRDGAFLVDRSLRRDVWVPFDAVQSVTDRLVTLNVLADDVNDMGWESPPLLKSDLGTDNPERPLSH
jgi:hypothetical protein